MGESEAGCMQRSIPNMKGEFPGSVLAQRVIALVLSQVRSAKLPESTLKGRNHKQRKTLESKTVFLDLKMNNPGFYTSVPLSVRFNLGADTFHGGPGIEITWACYSNFAIY